MTYDFRPAKREGVNLLVGIAAPTGAGKTYSAMLLAKGLSGDQPFAVIDTEARRALHYADYFKFDHCDLDAPFSSERYGEAIKAADARGYKAIIIDSFSHEHEGEGGFLDTQETELDEMVARAIERKDNRKEWEIREAMKRSAWIKPKSTRKRMMQTILHCKAHLIFCLRAQDKIDFVKDEKGKTKVVPMQTLSGYKGWIPICDARFPFELTSSFIMLPDKPGVPVPIKLQEQHKPFFPLDKPMGEESGRLISAWASGGAKTVTTKQDGITRDQAKRFTTDFEAALNEKLRPNTLPLLDAWMKKQGLSGLGAIAPSDFDLTLESAVQYAKECVG